MTPKRPPNTVEGNPEGWSAYVVALEQRVRELEEALAVLERLVSQETHLTWRERAALQVARSLLAEQTEGKR